MLLPAVHTYSSYMGAFLEEYLVLGDVHKSHHLCTGAFSTLLASAWTTGQAMDAPQSWTTLRDATRCLRYALRCRSRTRWEGDASLLHSTLS